MQWRDLKFDAVVMGAGPAGLAFSLASVRAGMRVCLLSRGGVRPVGEVVPGSIRVPLHNLGAWDAFQATRPVQANQTVSLWSDDVPAERPAIFDPYGAAWFIDREQFESRLLEMARREGVQILEKGEIRKATARSWQILDRNGFSFGAADLLVLATGRKSSAAGNASRETRDRLVGLVAYHEAVRRPPSFLLEAAESGWWYSATLPDRRSVTAFMTDADLLPRGGRGRQLQNWTDHFMQTRLLRDELGAFTVVSLVIRRAGGMLQKQAHGDDWIAIGDAASSYDPLCGQGIVTALAKGVTASLLLTRESRSAAFAAYASAEREAFQDYERELRLLYRQAAASRRSEFWQRRG